MSVEFGICSECGKLVEEVFGDDFDECLPCFLREKEALFLKDYIRTPVSTQMLPVSRPR